MNQLTPPNRRLGSIPSTQSLRSFDAVARLGSTVSAAAYLHITPSAVTHQLRKLEETVGTQLVRRVGRRIELTAAGNRYALQIGSALEMIAEASLPDSTTEPGGNINILTEFGFGAFWLSKHLKRFCALYPDLTISILSPEAQREVYANDIDIAIVYGDGVWPETHVELLYTPEFFPVCSPQLIDSLRELSHPNDMAKYPLLHHKDYKDWASWLAASGATNVKVNTGITFTDVNHCMSAAIAGLGIAIGDSVLSNQGLKDGTLVKLFSNTVPGPKSYYLVARERKILQPNCAAFLKWIVKEFNNHG